MVLTIVTSNGLYAGGNNVVNCCNAAGSNISISNCTCFAGSSASVGRAARGDVVTLNTAGAPVTQISTAKGTRGTILVPAAGTMHRYQFGDINLVFATFYLQKEEQPLNPKVDTMLQKIINVAALKYPWATVMVWVGRSLPGETKLTEVTETYLDMVDPAAARVNYETLSNKALKITIPASEKTPEQELTVDFKPILK